RGRMGCYRLGDGRLPLVLPWRFRGPLPAPARRRDRLIGVVVTAGCQVRYCTVENSVGRQNSFRMLATILSGVSLATRAEIQSGSATNLAHFSSRSASDSQASR